MKTPRHLIHQTARQDWANVGDVDALEEALDAAETDPEQLLRSTLAMTDLEDREEAIAYEAEWFSVAASAVAKKHPKLAASARCVSRCFLAMLRE